VGITKLKAITPMFLVNLLFVTIIILFALKTYSVSENAAMGNQTVFQIFDTVNLSKSFSGNTNYANLITASDDVITMNNLQSRNELLSNVSSYDDLHKILAKYRNFIQMPAIYFTTNNKNSNSSYAAKATTIPSGTIDIYYSSNLGQLDKTRYLALMLKFTNSFGELATKRVDYDIIIINRDTNSALRTNGTTFSGGDIRLISEDSLPKGLNNTKPTSYKMHLNVTNFNNNTVNEYTKPLKLLG
jgi:hypothetical protein